MDYIKRKQNLLLVTKEPLAGADLSTIFSLLKQNRFHVSLPYVPRIIYSLFLSGMLSVFRFKEHKKFDSIIHGTSLDKSPLFLLGHWRSGTTYLHNLLSKDSQFGFFSTFDAYLPGAFLGSEKILKPVVAASLPAKRPMDDVLMGADLPQEEEYALGGISVYSYYNGWIFPQNMQQYNRYVWLDDVSHEVVSDFKRKYLYLIKKASVKHHGRRLLLKNPSNTARVKILLEMFPDAKFVHITRNPYHQFLSMVRFMKMVIPLYCVQVPPPFDVVEDSLLEMYKHMYQKYFSERRLIPKGNLVELRYEDFISDPLSEVRKVYKGLGLDGFDDVQRMFEAYILSQSEIHLASYDLSDEIREKVYSRLSFVFENFGYER